MFDTIVGQETAKKTIGSMITTDRLPHALLFAGPNGTGKTETALDLARMLLCKNGLTSECGSCSTCTRTSKLEHPDLHVLFPFRAEPASAEKRDSWVEELVSLKNNLAGEHYAPVVYEKNRQIVVGLAREVHERLQESSFEGGRRVCVILEAERMNAHTANSFLKILEEPPDGVHFIMTTERLSSVLPTITSRASVVRFRRLKEEEIAGYLENTCNVESGLYSSCASMAEGSLKTAKAFAFEKKADIRYRAFDVYCSAAMGNQDDVIGLSFPFMQSRDLVEAEELIGGFAQLTRSVLEAKCGKEMSGDTISEKAAHLAGSTDIMSLRDLAVKLEDGLEMLGRNVNVSTVITSILYGIHDAYRY